jgi:hypothetical protein
MAENLAASLRTYVSEPANDSNGILIGFTAEDMYPTPKDWQFAFWLERWPDTHGGSFNGATEPG